MLGVIPKLRPGGRGTARVTLNGIDVYCGPWGSPESKSKYDSVIAQWLAQGRVWRRPHASTHTTTSAAAITLAGLSAAYLEHARRFYRKNGRPTSTLIAIERSLELLAMSGPQHTRGMHSPAASFGPLALTAYRAYLAADTHGRWSRNTINLYAQIIVWMFKWAVSQQLVDVTIWQTLTSVSELSKGRSPGVDFAGEPIPAPRESIPVLPVPRRQLAATIKHAPPIIAAMIRLQVLAAMRPNEVCGLKRAHLHATANATVFAYAVPDSHNKLDWRDIARTVLLGPKAMAILKPWLTPDPDAFIFTPARSRELRLATTPKTRRRKPASKQRRTYSACYNTNTYAQAIERACHRACRAAKLSEDKWWVWTPNRLRHNGATDIADAEDIDTARMILGHGDEETTKIYTKSANKKAIKAAARRL